MPIESQAYVPVALVDDQVMRDHYRQFAAKIWPRGCTLRCPQCGRTQTATVGEIAGYLAKGWATCHGKTMHVGEAETN